MIIIIILTIVNDIVHLNSFCSHSFLFCLFVSFIHLLMSPNINNNDDDVLFVSPFSLNSIIIIIIMSISGKLNILYNKYMRIEQKKMLKHK